MSYSRRTDRNEISFPLEQYDTGISPNLDLAFCPMQPRDNFAPYAENFHPGSIHTANPVVQSSINSQPAPDFDFGLLGDDPAVWVWDGVSR
jgi:hypothetical protein